MPSHGQDFVNESWELHPVFDVPDRFPPAVMFSIFDVDPRPRYENTLQNLMERQRKGDSATPSSIAPEMLRQGLLHVAWDSVFKDVTGEKMGLLFRNEGRQAGDEEDDSTPLYAVLIKSYTPVGGKWLVTRALQFEGRTVCWCEPFEVRVGERTEVALTEDSMITLEMS